MPPTAARLLITGGTGFSLWCRLGEWCKHRRPLFLPPGQLIIVRRNNCEDRALLHRLSNANLDVIRKEIEEITPPGTTHVATSVDLPVSHPLKRALAFASEDAERLNHRHIGTGHLLLGLLREPDSIVPDLLHKYGINRAAVLREIAGPSSNQESPGQQSPAERAGTGRYSSTRKEGDAEVSETHHFFHGHEIVLIERLSLSGDGKTLSYTQEISGPGTSTHHTIDFGVS